MTVLTRFQVAVGDRFVKGGAFALVEAVSIASPAFVRLRGDDGEIEQLDLDEFRRAVAAGVYRRPLQTDFRIGSSSVENSRPSAPAQFTEEAAERAALMRHVQTLRSAGHSWKRVVQLLHDEGYPMDGTWRPCPLNQRRIQEIFGAWRREGDRVLKPRTDLRGNRESRFDDLYADIANRVIDRLFVRSEQMRVSRAANIAQQEYLQECRRRELAPKACSLKAFESVLSQRSQIELLAQKLDPRTAKRLLRQATQQFSDLFPLDRVELDCTMLPVHCRDEYMNAIGRPWVCAAIDVAARAALAVTVTLESPSGEIVLKTLKAAMQPDDPESSLDGFDPFGGIHTIAFDRGRENDNTIVRNFIQNLGLATPNDIPGRPERRPHVERFFRSLKEALADLPGGVSRVGSGAENMTERAVEQGTLMLEELEGFVHDWVRRVYHHTPHAALSRRFRKPTSPAQAWDAMREAVAINLPPTGEELYEASLLRDGEPRKVQHYGVDVCGARYHSSDLAEFRKTVGADMHVEVYIDPSDTRQVRAVTPDGKHVFDLQCTWKMPAMTLKELKRFNRSVKPTEDDRAKAENARRDLVERAITTATSPKRKRDAREAKKSRDRANAAIQNTIKGPSPVIDINSEGMDRPPSSGSITRSKGL